MQNGKGTLEKIWQFLTKVNIPLTIQFGNHAPCCLPKEAENAYPCKSLHTDTCSNLIMVIAWKQPRCPSADEWINCYSQCCSVSEKK